MVRIVLAAGAAAIASLALGTPAAANPGDEWRKQFEIRAECDEKLAKADSRREFHKELRECRKKLAEWDAKQREEAFKAWQENEKKWRERWDD